jgi:hypothetical protein
VPYDILRRLPRKGVEIVVLVLFFVLALITLAAPGQRPRIAIGGIMHESDTFNPTKTSLSDFTRRRTTPPEQALAEWAKSNDEISGYIEGAQKYGLDLVPVLMASATPKGPVTDEAFNTLTGELTAQLRAAPRLERVRGDRKALYRPAHIQRKSPSRHAGARHSGGAHHVRHRAWRATAGAGDRETAHDL